MASVARACVQPTLATRVSGDRNSNKPCSTSSEGAGGDNRTGHGFRQTRPRLRHSFPNTGLGGGLLPTGGRAGRALESAYGVLLSGQEEAEINDYFIESAFPSREEVEQVLAALHAAPGGLSIYELMVEVNARWGRLDKAVQLMSLESPAPLSNKAANGC